MSVRTAPGAVAWIVVVDGEHGWVGGLNIGEEYLGRDPALGAMRDTHLRLSGAAAIALQLAFLEDWHWATGGKLPELGWAPKPVAGGVSALVLASGPADRFETASLMVQTALHSARRRAWISSPYFVPDEGVLAALRGVDVRILNPERTNILATLWAMYAFLRPLLGAGVKVQRYQPGFLHGKVWLIDDMAAIGTVNLDNRSFRLNFEITVWIPSCYGSCAKTDVFILYKKIHNVAARQGTKHHDPGMPLAAGFE